MDLVHCDRMSLYRVLLLAVTARTWSGWWHYSTLEQCRRLPLCNMGLRTLPKLTASAKLATCEGSWFSPFVDCFAIPSERDGSMQGKQKTRLSDRRVVHC